MAKTNTVIRVEVDGPGNENLLFRPLLRRIRGRFDPHRMDNPGHLTREWRDGIPGQVLGIDPATGTAWIEEPLHRPEHAATKQKILAKRMNLLPEREEFPGVHVPTWLYWLRGAVECGLARVIEGELPEDDLGGDPQLSFIRQPKLSDSQRLAAAIERQNELMAQLLARK